MMGDVHHVMGVPNHLSICDVKLHACMHAWHVYIIHVPYMMYLYMVMGVNI